MTSKVIMPGSTRIVPPPHAPEHDPSSSSEYDDTDDHGIERQNTHCCCCCYCCRFDVTASFCYTCTCNEVRMLLLLTYERCTITPLSSSSSGWISHTTIPRSVRIILVVVAAATVSTLPLLAVCCYCGR